MADWQRNQHITDIGALKVYVARWPGLPEGRTPLVMWEEPSGRSHYLTPSRTRQFAQGLILAAAEAETDKEADGQ